MGDCLKVGVVSQFVYDNFGNKLQNFALQQVLRGYAETVITIKNNPRAENAAQRLCWFTFVAEAELLYRLSGRNRKAESVRFHHTHIKDSVKWYCLNEEAPSLHKMDVCNFYCAGSDQVWKPGSGRAGALHYLGFADREQTFSYAASFGVEEIPEEHKEAVRKGLQHIKHISVREDAGKRIVEELTGRTDVEVLVDPTMLLTTQEWDKILRAPKAKLPEKYILTYFLGPVSTERRAAIQQKADQMGCQIIEVMDKNSPFYAIGPDMFVYLIKHAQMVCTDSFHGSVFSFLYQRRLAVFDREGSGNNMGSRIDTLAAKFHLEHCRVKGNVLPGWDDEPDYTEGYKELETEREKSKRFLDKVFNKEQ